MRNLNLFIILVFFLASCGDEAVKLPKPRMYPRIIFPEKTFTYFDSTACNFVFKHPKYAIIKPSVGNEKNTSQCWFDLKIDSLNATLHCSYHGMRQGQSLSKLINDVFEIADKHNKKANYRRENNISNANGVKGTIIEIEGPVASPLQFYVTDEKRHFFRASLYFNSKVNPDSTAAVYQFLKSDIDTIINTFKWKN